MKAIIINSLFAHPTFLLPSTPLLEYYESFIIKIEKPSKNTKSNGILLVKKGDFN